MFYHGALSLFPSCTFCFSVFSGIPVRLDFSSSSFSTQKSCLYLLASYCLLSFLLYKSQEYTFIQCTNDHSKQENHGENPLCFRDDWVPHNIFTAFYTGNH